MKQIIYRLGKVLLFLIPVAAALAATIYLVDHKPGPSQKQTTEAVQTLRVIPAPVVDLLTAEKNPAPSRRTWLPGAKKSVICLMWSA